MKKFFPFFFFAMFLSLLSCSQNEPAASSVPPSGLAGAPQSPPPHNQPKSPPALPQGHPPVGDAFKTPPVPNLPASLGHLGATTKPQTDRKLRGTVLEIHDAASYTYLKFKPVDAKEQWAAVLKVDIKKGQQVEVNQQMVMEDFQSKSLNRTFDRIIFGTAKLIQ